MTSNDIDQCTVQSSSGKVRFVEYNYHRYPQLENLKTGRKRGGADFGALSNKCDVVTKPFPSRLRDYVEERL